MVTYCFDASACLRFLDGEEGSVRVSQIIRLCSSGDAKLILSAIQWGEIASVTIRRGSARSVPGVLSRLLQFGFQPMPASPLQATVAASIQNELGIPYADAFLVALTLDQQQAILVTADFDFKAAEHLVTIEFLPAKAASAS